MEPRMTPGEERAQELAAQRAESFNLRGGALVMTVLAFIILPFAELANGPAPMEEMASRIGGSLFGVALLVILPAWLVHKFARSRRAPAWTAGILATLLILGALGRIGTSAKEREAGRALLQDMEASHERLRQSTQQNGGIELTDETIETVEQMADQLQSRAGDLGKTDAAMARAMSDLFRSLSGPLSEYKQAMDAFEASGGVDAAGIASPDQLDSRLAIIDRFEIANEKLDAIYKLAPERLRDSLTNGGLSARAVDQAVSGFESTAGLDLVTAVRETDRQIIASARGILGVLKSEWGRWELTEQGDLIFESDAALTTYNAHHVKLVEAVAEQERLQQQVIQRQQQNAKRP